MSAAVMSMSEADTTPGYPWFQEREAARAAQVKIVELNHLADVNEKSRQEISYGNRDRMEKVSFGIREAVERNGLAETTAVERNSSENRITTLKSKSEEARQEAANFEKVFLGAKDIRLAQAKEVSNQTITGLKTALEIGSSLSGGKSATQELALQQAQEAADLKNKNSWEHAMLHESQVSGFTRVELEQLCSQFGSEKDQAFLAIQAQGLHGDDNRRMALYRAESESRVEAVTAAAALQAAENRTKEILYQMDNEDCCCETKLLVAETNAETAGVIAAAGAGAIRDSLIAAQQEAVMLRLRRRSHHS
jgi:hypothetical protein